jgi:predicted outer membrane repeat protein
MSRITSFLHFAAAMAIGLMSTAAAHSRQNTIHVPGDYATIQAAIDAAESGDTIIVAPGTYHEAIDFLGKTLTLESEAGAVKTIIDATGLDTSVVTVTSGEGEGTTLRGFTITGGAGTLFGNNRRGGGVLLNSSHLRIEHCIIANNHVEHDGGGIGTMPGSVVHAIETLIEGNTAGGGGGGVWISGSPSDTEQWHRFEQCTFRGNTAVATGGGLHVRSNGRLSLVQCLFEGNAVTAVQSQGSVATDPYGLGGGICIRETSSSARFHIAECTFESNIAALGGGAAHAVIASDPRAWPRFVDCTFRYNTAPLGGGITHSNSSQYSRVIIERCLFEHNAAPFGPYRYGGALYSGGGHFIVRHSTFRNNSANVGGAAHVRGLVEFCTFENNHAEESGGAVSVGSSQLRTTVRHSSFFGNTAKTRGGAIRSTAWQPVGVIGCDFIGNTAASEFGAIWRESGALELGSSYFCDNAPDDVSSYTDLGGNAFPIKCVSPNTRHVPSQFATIQEAIDASIHHDEIIVAPGTYNEAIDFGGRRISIVSSAGSEKTVIDATGFATSAVTAASYEGPGTLLRGFTITGGTGTMHDGSPHGGGIFILGAGLEIEDCFITGNTAHRGAGAAVDGPSPDLMGYVTIRSSTVSDNHTAPLDSSAHGGGVFVRGSAIDFDICTITGNSAFRGGGLALHPGVGDDGWAYGGSAWVMNSAISGNEANTGGGVTVFANAALSAVSCEFEGNIAHHFGAAGHIAGSASFAACLFRNNIAQNLAALVLSGETSVPISDTLFCGSEPAHIGGPGVWSDLGGNEFLDDCPAPGSPADLNGDGVVDVLDLLILLDAWGACKDCGDCPADFNGDCAVDVLDLLFLFDNWG